MTYTFVQILRAATELALLDEHSARYDAVYLKNRRTQLNERLEATLGLEGLQAVLGVRKAMEAKFGTVSDAALTAAQVRIIRYFMKPAGRATPDSSSAAKLPLRERLTPKNNPVNKTSLKPGWREIVRSGYARAIAGVVGALAWVLLADALYRWLARSYPAIESVSYYGLWALSVVAYFSAIWTIRKRLSNSLHGLLAAEGQSGEATTKLLTAYIGWAFVVGATIMILLLMFDYYSHTAAAAAVDVEADLAAKAAMQGGPTWGISAAAPPQGKSQPGLLAEVGAFAGTFGDFFGGVVNPILTFGTLLALTITILMQRTQLFDEKQRSKDATASSNLQNFENTFFQLMGLHGATIEALRFAPKNILLPSEKARPVYQQIMPLPRQERLPEQVSGRAVFTCVLDLMYHLHREATAQRKWHDDWIKEPHDAYLLFQTQYNDVLGHYFRNLFQVLAFVDRHPTRLAETSVEAEHDIRKRYANMLRAQLSAHELSILFYNCLDRVVDDGAFRAIVVEYEFLEHMPVEYWHSDHTLRISGYVAPITELLRQYLGKGQAHVKQSGAFGSNPEVAEFLEIERLLHPRPRPSRCASSRSDMHTG